MAASANPSQRLPPRADPPNLKEIGSSELQRRFVREYFDALAQGGALLLRAAGEAAEQAKERQRRERGGSEGAGGKAALAGRS